MIPAICSIFLDYVCNFACSHCSVGSSPKTKFPMPEQVFDRIFEELPTLPTLKVVVFTGGEPTLKKDVLLKGIHRAHELGYVTRLVTNGWWAKDMDRARSFVDDLKGSGLNELSTSWDDFHEPYGNCETVLNCIDAAVQGGLRVVMAAIVGQGASWNSGRIRESLAGRWRISSRDVDRRVFIIEDNPTPSGSAEGVDIKGLPEQKALGFGCRDIVSTISFHPDGSVKACCGHAMFYTPHLTIGNILNEPLQAMVSRGQRNVLYWWIHSAGPLEILRRMGVAEESYSSICHACHDLFQNHSASVIDFVIENRDEILVNEIVLSDKVKRLMSLVEERKSEITERIVKA